MPGCFSRISFAARSPSSVWVGGILMSTIAMSGLYERTFSSRSSAVPLCPTISNPASRAGWRCPRGAARSRRRGRRGSASPRLASGRELDVDAVVSPTAGREQPEISGDTSSASIADADSSALGTKPSAGLPATSAPKSAPSRLDVRITQVRTSRAKTLRDLESVNVRELNIDEHQVGTVLLRPFDPAVAGFRLRRRRESMALEQLTRGWPEVAVVVDEEDTTGMKRSCQRARRCAVWLARLFLGALAWRRGGRHRDDRGG